MVQRSKVDTMTVTAMKKKDSHKKNASSGPRLKSVSNGAALAAASKSPSFEPRRLTMTPTIEQMDKATQGLMQAFEEMNVSAKAFGEAAMQSASAMSKGWEEISRSASGIMQESMARTMSAGKTLMAAKNPKEMMDMQAEFVKDCFDYWMAGTGKISEISARVTQEVIDPVAQHANATMSKIMVKTRAA
jgi:phasin family protein